MTRNLLPRLAFAALLLAAPAVAEAQAGTPVDAAAALVKQGRYDAARQAVAAYARSHPRDGWAALWLGRAYLGQDSTDEAVVWLEKAAPLVRTADAYLSLAQGYGVQASYSTLFEQPFLTRKVRDALQSAVRAEPRNVKPLLGLLQFNLATPWLFGGSKSDAEQQARALARISPYFGSVGRAVVQANTNDMLGAERTLTALGRQYPDSADPVSMLAGLHRQRQQWNRAWAALDAFTRRNPANRRILFDVGATALASGQRLDQGERALVAYLSAPVGADMPPAALARYQLGQLYEKKGRKDLARMQYQQVLREDPHMLSARSALDALNRPPPK